MTGSRPHTILALDLGENLGWAYAEDGKIRCSATERLAVTKDDKPAQKYINFHNWLQDWWEVDEIIFEIVVAHGPGQVKAAHAYGAYKGILEMFAYSSRIPLFKYGVSTIKKAVTGSGGKGVGKADVCRCLHDMGWKGGKYGTAAGNDEADACGLIFARGIERGTPVSFELWED